MDLLAKHPDYVRLQACLQGDAQQQQLDLRELGWIDDWMVFANEPEMMTAKLKMWSDVLAQVGWRFNEDKLVVLYVSCFATPIYFQDRVIPSATSMAWLGCIINASGSAFDHVQHRTSLAIHRHACIQASSKLFSFTVAMVSP